MAFNQYIKYEDHAIIFIVCKGKTYECLVELDILDKLIFINKKVSLSYSVKRPGKYYANIKYWDSFEQSLWIVYVHRLTLGLENASSKIKVDHKNHNTLDNKRENLVATSNAMNMLNRINVQSNNTTGALRVDYMKNKRKYRARITVNGNEIHLGLYSNMLEAEQAVKDYRQKVLADVK